MNDPVQPEGPDQPLDHAPPAEPTGPGTASTHDHPAPVIGSAPAEADAWFPSDLLDHAATMVAIDRLSEAADESEAPEELGAAARVLQRRE